MASKYLQKYPVPAGFQEILHDFTREVLRDQPPNIIEYAAKYFEMLEKGKKFEYESKFNVKKDDRKNQLQYNPKAAEDITKKATAAVTKINAQPDPPKKEERQKIAQATVEVHTSVHDVSAAHKEAHAETHTARVGSADAHVDAGPSIKHIGGDTEHEPTDHPMSTNTLIKETGHNYMQELNKHVDEAEAEADPETQNAHEPEDHEEGHGSHEPHTHHEHEPHEHHESEEPHDHHHDHHHDLGELEQHELPDKHHSPEEAHEHHEQEGEEEEGGLFGDEPAEGEAKEEGEEERKEKGEAGEEAEEGAQEHGEGKDQPEEHATPQ